MFVLNAFQSLSNYFLKSHIFVFYLNLFKFKNLHFKMIPINDQINMKKTFLTFFSSLFLIVSLFLFSFCLFFFPQSNRCSTSLNSIARKLIAKLMLFLQLLFFLNHRTEFAVFLQYYKNLCAFTLHTLIYIGHDNSLHHQLKMGYKYNSTNHNTTSVKIEMYSQVITLEFL